MTAWLGLDIGTSSVKALVVDESGTVLWRGSADYPAEAGIRHHEQDALDYLAAVRDALDGFDTSGLTGIGVVGQTPSLVLADDDGAPVRPVLTWRDGRPDVESRLLEQALGDSEQVVGVANLWAPSHLPAKLHWLARTEPHALRAARWALTPKDFVGYRLTDAAATDPWSAKGLWSVRDGRVADAVFDLIGAPATLLPPARAPWEPLGPTTVRAAADTGIPAGVPVAVGWSDALAGMLGIGAATEPRSFVLTGTSDIVGTSVGGPRGGDDPVDAGLYRVPRPIAPLEIDYGPTQSSGASLLWLARALGRSAADLVQLAGDAEDTASTFLPYLRGERAPLWDPELRGSLTGLAETDGPAQLALAVLRGVALSGRHVLERSCADPADDSPVHLGGGNVFQRGWIRARSEALARDLVLHTEPQLTALGAAMLGRSAARGEAVVESRRVLADRTVLVPADPDTRDRAARLRSGYLRDVVAAQTLARLGDDGGL